jgi:hypothetical protein
MPPSKLGPVFGLGIPIALVLMGSLLSFESEALPVTSFLGLLKLPLRLP